MNGPVTTVACPNGHASPNRTVCTVCGALIPAEGRDGAATPLRTEGVPRHLAAAPPIDPAEARHMTQLAPLPSLRPEVEPGSGPAGPPPAAPAYQPPPQMAAMQPIGQTMAGGSLCPHCSAELHPGARFCEVCGYDPSTGSLPHVYAPVVRPAVLPEGQGGGGSGPTGGTGARYAAPSSGSVPGHVPAAGPLTGRWTATITADRAYYESHQVGDVQFPLGVPPRTIELPTGPISIGRRSRSRGTNPAIDLSGPPEDPAVSHTHASLLPSDDGTWKLIDHGSTNGTFVNESLDALAANQPVRIVPGDRVYVGAWTRITLDLHSH
jgi:hypothetical protein